MHYTSAMIARMCCLDFVCTRKEVYVICLFVPIVLSGTVCMSVCPHCLVRDHLYVCLSPLTCPGPSAWLSVTIVLSPGPSVCLFVPIVLSGTICMSVCLHCLVRDHLYVCLSQLTCPEPSAWLSVTIVLSGTICMYVCMSPSSCPELNTKTTLMN